MHPDASIATLERTGPSWVMLAIATARARFVGRTEESGLLLVLLHELLSQGHTETSQL